MNETCPLHGNQHHWQYADQLRRDEITHNTDSVQVGDKTIDKKSYTCKKSDYYNLLFYCQCGRLKTIRIGGNDKPESTASYDQPTINLNDSN